MRAILADQFRRVKYRKYRTLQLYYFHVFSQTRACLHRSDLRKRLVCHAENPLRARAEAIALHWHAGHTGSS